MNETAVAVETKTETETTVDELIGPVRDVPTMHYGWIFGRLTFCGKAIESGWTPLGPAPAGHEICGTCAAELRNIRRAWGLR